MIKEKHCAIGYIRISTQEQDEKYGKDAQRMAISKYAKEHGLTIVSWFTDVVSGVSDEREELNKLLYGYDVANPPFEAIIVFKSDRLARDTKLYFYYLYLLEKKGVKLISVEENFGDDETFANIYRSMMLFVAEQERKNIALRTSHGREIKANAGGYAGGGVPFGYKVEKGQLVINDAEARIVQEIFSLDKDNISQVKIAQYLNEQGFRTKTGTPFNQVKIHYIINNRKLYQGYIKYGGKKAQWVKGVHTPILDE